MEQYVGMKKCQLSYADDHAKRRNVSYYYNVIICLTTVYLFFYQHINTYQLFFFFLNDPPPPELSPLPLHDPLPTSRRPAPPRDTRNPRPTTPRPSTQWQSAASWHQFLRQFHRICRWKFNVIHCAPTPPCPRLRWVSLWQFQVHRGILRGQVSQRTIRILPNKKSCVLANFRQLRARCYRRCFRERRERISIENRRMHNLHGRKNASHAHHRADFGANSRTDCGKILARICAEVSPLVGKRGVLPSIQI